MADMFRPGGVVPLEEVMSLTHHYRIVMQDMTSYGTPKGYQMIHDLGLSTRRFAQASLEEHRGHLRGRMVMWLESAPLGTEVWQRVPADG